MLEVIEAPVKEMSKFKVVYSLQTFTNHLGETELLTERIMETETDSDDFYHAFVELSERHKYDQVCGLTILEII